MDIKFEPRLNFKAKMACIRKKELIIYYKKLIAKNILR